MENNKLKWSVEVQDMTMSMTCEMNEEKFKLTNAGFIVWIHNPKINFKCGSIILMN